MKRTGFLAYGLILILVFCSGMALLKSDSPEQLIMGKWEEVEWQFERIDADSAKMDHKLLDYQKKELYENMMIHNAEEWEFFPGKLLTLRQHERSGEKKLKWLLKGRGHILELQYGNEKVESFQVYKLTKDTLVVYYNFDLQMRGSVKITFKKQQQYNYAQKI